MKPPAPVTNTFISRPQVNLSNAYAPDRDQWLRPRRSERFRHPRETIPAGALALQPFVEVPHNPCRISPRQLHPLLRRGSRPHWPDNCARPNGHARQDHRTGADKTRVQDSGRGRLARLVPRNTTGLASCANTVAWVIRQSEPISMKRKQRVQRAIDKADVGHWIFIPRP